MTSIAIYVEVCLLLDDAFYELEQAEEYRSFIIDEVPRGITERYEKSSIFDPNNHEHYMRLGSLCSLVGKDVEAIEKLDIVIELCSIFKPDDIACIASCYSLIGEIYISLGEYDNAAESFQFAIDNMPDESTYYYYLSNAYMLMKDFDKFMEVYLKAIDISS